MLYQVYAKAAGKESDESKDLIGMYETEREARERVRQAIASGYHAGYIKQGFELVAYLTEKSFCPAGKP